MSEVDVMMVMDTMAQMFETLVKRIAALGRELDALRLERCSCERMNCVKPQAVTMDFEDGWLSQEELDGLLEGVTKEPNEWAEALINIVKERHGNDTSTA